MATISPRLPLRDNKGCFRRPKELKRRELSAASCKKPRRNIEDVVTNAEDHCVSKRCFEFQGRRIVELGELAKEFESGCKSCGAPLRLLDCFQETISGLGSF